MTVPPNYIGQQWQGRALGVDSPVASRLSGPVLPLLVESPLIPPLFPIFLFQSEGPGTLLWPFCIFVKLAESGNGTQVTLRYWETEKRLPAVWFTQEVGSCWNLLIQG